MAALSSSSLRKSNFNDRFASELELKRMVAQVKYSMGFIGGALLHKESLKIADVHSSQGDWSKVGEAVLQSNLLQARTITSAKRISSEVITRLQVLTDRELDLLITGTRQEQQYLLWLAVCKRYPFVRDFAVEVLREKYLQHDLKLTAHDCDAFLNAKAEWTHELEHLSKTTREKIRQILMKLMREADLLTRDNRINPSILSKRFIEVVSEQSSAYLAVFPVSEASTLRCRH